MAYDLTRATLGQLLASEDITIKRNAMSILKVMQKCDHAPADRGPYSHCMYCFKPMTHADLCPDCGWMPDGSKCVNPDCKRNALQ